MEPYRPRRLLRERDGERRACAAPRMDSRGWLRRMRRACGRCRRRHGIATTDVRTATALGGRPRARIGQDAKGHHHEHRDSIEHDAERRDGAAAEMADVGQGTRNTIKAMRMTPKNMPQPKPPPFFGRSMVTLVSTMRPSSSRSTWVSRISAIAGAPWVNSCTGNATGPARFRLDHRPLKLLCARKVSGSSRWPTNGPSRRAS